MTSVRDGIPSAVKGGSLVCATLGSLYLLRGARSWVWILGGTIASVTTLLLVRLVLRQRPRGRVLLANISLLVASTGLLLTGIELGLDRLATRHVVDVTSQNLQPTMPDDLMRHPVTVEGAARAKYWQGKLHIYNKDSFRHLGDYTLDRGMRRIVILGDSLTYGEGIAQEDTYPELLQTLLRSRDPRFMTYNLGQDGAQSEDIVRNAKRWIPILKPELVIYGICLNDFLPSGAGQYDNNMAWQFPLPKWIVTPIETKTRIGALVSDSYNRSLIRLGIRRDFYSDILKNFNDYQDRFGRDLIELNRFVVEQTGAPVLAMVLDQFPQSKQGYEISRVAEAKARAASMNVIPTDDYYKQYGNGSVQLYVNKWEGHPNELANRIFAEMIDRHQAAQGK